MGESLLVSDLHLAPERPGTVELFLAFLRGRARSAERLYILGDLFDTWIGDDDDSPPGPAVRAALRELGAAGVACLLMHGNRDFLIGRRFARDTGCTLLRDPTRADLAGAPILLMHGDLLCTDDVPYQRFRRKVRNPLIQRLFLWKPLAARRAMAADYRRKSGAATAAKPEQIMDVNQQAVERAMRRNRVLRLIHGHTHRPADHVFRLDGRDVTRSVLAEWHEDRGEVLVVSADGVHREAVRPGA
jgi:UDP-2,3-diacylglucosamine hydrolase